MASMSTSSRNTVSAILFVLGVCALGVAVTMWVESRFRAPQIEVKSSPRKWSDRTLGDHIAKQTTAALGGDSSVVVNQGPALVLRLSSSASEGTEFFVALTDISPQSIFNATLPPLTNGLVVRSTDEKRRRLAGLTTRLADGCGLNSKLQPISSGSASAIETCDGAYLSNDGIAGIIDIVAVPHSEYACWTPDRSVCVKRNLRMSIDQLLEVARKASGYGGLVLPASGTGVGKQAPNVFYEAFSEIYRENVLENVEGIPMVVFSVYVDQWTENGEAIKTAIGEALSKISLSWRDATLSKERLKTKSSRKWATVLGTASGILLSLGVLLFLSPQPSDTTSRLRRPLKVFSDAGFPSIVGYLILAFPVSSGLHDYLRQLVGDQGLAMHVVLSASAVPLLLLLALTKGQAESRLKDLGDTAVKAID